MAETRWARRASSPSSVRSRSPSPRRTGTLSSRTAKQHQDQDEQVVVGMFVDRTRVVARQGQKQIFDLMATLTPDQVSRWVQSVHRRNPDVVEALFVYDPTSGKLLLSLTGEGRIRVEDLHLPSGVEMAQA